VEFIDTRVRCVQRGRQTVEFSPHNLLADQKSWGLAFRKNTPYSLYNNLYRVIASDE
jgi:hypothetical protein